MINKKFLRFGKSIPKSSSRNLEIQRRKKLKRIIQFVLMTSITAILIIALRRYTASSLPVLSVIEKKNTSKKIFPFIIYALPYFIIPSKYFVIRYLFFIIGDRSVIK